MNLYSYNPLLNWFRMSVAEVLDRPALHFKSTMVSYGLVKLGFTSTWFSLLDDVAFWTHKDESSLVFTFLGGSSRFDTSLSWSLDARLYFRTPFKFLCPVVFMSCCSSKQLWHNWVAHVRLPDWFVKLPSKPAFQHIFFVKFSSLFTPIFCFENLSVPEMGRF